MKTLTVEDLFRTKAQSLQLELLTPDCGLLRAIQSPTVSSPGLVLAGYMGRAPRGRLQVLGETEVGYLRSLPEDEMRSSLETLLSLDVPAVFITKGQEAPPTFGWPRTTARPRPRFGCIAADRRCRPAPAATPCSLRSIPRSSGRSGSSAGGATASLTTRRQRHRRPERRGDPA